MDQSNACRRRQRCEISQYYVITVLRYFTSPDMSNIAHFTLYSVANLHVSDISDMRNIAQ